MVNFDEFITDLHEASLLDEKVGQFKPDATPYLDTAKEITKSFHSNLDEVEFVRINRDQYLPENQPESTKEDSKRPPTMENIPKKLKSKKSGRSRKHCPTCLVRLPKYSIRCKFCHRRVISNSSIVILVAGAALIALIVLFIAALSRP